MANVATGFWAGWVLVITVVSAIGFVWVVMSVYFGRDDSDDHAHVVWDETLREGTTPAPLWWFWLTLALLATSVVYLILYPGLGPYRGTLQWSQGGRSPRASRATSNGSAPSAHALRRRPQRHCSRNRLAMRSAWHLFNNHCTACHGPNGRGQADLFPDLGDDSWQWGGDEQQLTQTITQGRPL